VQKGEYNTAAQKGSLLCKEGMFELDRVPCIRYKRASIAQRRTMGPRSPQTELGREDFFVFRAKFIEDVDFMVLIRVQYDAYNRHFTVVDQESSRTLVDGEIYVLVADVSVKDLELRPVEIQAEVVPVLS
jgi:hypothetical protein